MKRDPRTNDLGPVDLPPGIGSSVVGARQIYGECLHRYRRGEGGMTEFSTPCAQCDATLAVERELAETALSRWCMAAKALVLELEKEATEWREDHPAGADDEVDYASGLLSAVSDLRELLAAAAEGAP